MTLTSDLFSDTSSDSFHCPQVQGIKNKVKTVNLSQSILKHKFPSIDKPLQNLKPGPQKGPLKTIRPRAYFQNLWYTCQMKPFHLLFYSDKLFPAFGFGARIPPSHQVCGLISFLPLEILDHYNVSGKLPTYPSPKPILTLTSQLEQNVGLGEG